MTRPADTLRDTSRLLVLMYHGLHAGRDDAGRFDPRYSVGPAAFAAQMARLAQRAGDVVVPDLSQPLRHAGDGRPPVLISFDDGDVTNATVALPLLQRLGLRAVFFITTDFIGRPGMLSQNQLREIADAGMVIGSHGASHRFLNTLDATRLEAELTESRAVLQQLSGQPVDLISLPGGRGGARELQAATRAGYRAVFGSQPGDNRHWRPGRMLQRLAMTRAMTDPAFASLLEGRHVMRMRLRHSLLAMPKRVLGDDRYDRLRQALVG